MSRLPLVLKLSILWGRKGETFLGSASPLLHFCQKICLTSAILQHMLDVNIMSPCLALTKKVTGEKKGSKNVLVSCMSLQFSSCSHFLFTFQWNKCWVSQKSKDALWLLPKVWQAGNICRLWHRCPQYEVHRSNHLVLQLSQPQQGGQEGPWKFPLDLYKLSLEPLD